MFVKLIIAKIKGYLENKKVRIAVIVVGSVLVLGIGTIIVVSLLPDRCSGEACATEVDDENGDDEEEDEPPRRPGRPDPEDEEPDDEPETGTGNDRRPTFRPINPDVTKDMAIEIGYAYLEEVEFERPVNIEFRFDYGMDWREGTWVWVLEYRNAWNWRMMFTLYVDVESGEVVAFRSTE